jgi:ABC-type multidrug transport system fused ATPase/permease subunit
MINIAELKQIFLMLPRKDRNKLYLVVVIQVLLSFLDLAGIAIIGVIGSVAVYGIQSKVTGFKVTQVLEFLNIENLPFQRQVAFLGLVAVVVFVAKSIISIYLIKRTLLFLGRRGALIASNLVTSLFSKSITGINKYTHQELIYAITNGIDVMTVRVIGSTVTLVSDIALLAVIFFGLFLVNFNSTILMFLVFTLLIIITSKIFKSRAFKYGSNEAAYGVESNEKISEILNTYRESVVKGRRKYYIDNIKELRYKLAEAAAMRNFLPNLNKYIMETTVIIGTLLISAIQFILNDASHAIANLTIFLAASTRIAPAVLRIQQGIFFINSGLGTVGRTLEIIKVSSTGSFQEIVNKLPNFSYEGFTGSVKINNLNFIYGPESEFKLSEINFTILPGQHLAISGSSGAGKTTLVDIILGVLDPTSGSIEISGTDPLSVFRKWPGATAYVPQDIVIIEGTVWQNVTLGFDFNQTHEPYIWEALKLSHLDEYVKNLPEGLLTKVGERGYKLSGGQRQRLGIARAMFTKPKLLVLDEATSALDGETEADIAEAIKSLKGITTVLLIAHRLSSVRSADAVIFMENGKILASGTFEEVRRIAPNFDKQANLMGL